LDVASSERRTEDIRQVMRRSPAPLCDLFSAAEAVGEYQRVGGGTAYFGQHDSFGATHRDVMVFTALESESPRHAAAPRVEDPSIKPDPLQDRSFGVETENRRMMAVRLDDRRPRVRREAHIVLDE
jgi:hypothetical protein